MNVCRFSSKDIAILKGQARTSLQTEFISVNKPKTKIYLTTYMSRCRVQYCKKFLQTLLSAVLQTTERFDCTQLLEAACAS